MGACTRSLSRVREGLDWGPGIEIDGSNLYFARPFLGLPLTYRRACEQRNFLFPDWDRRHRRHLLPDWRADRPMGQQSTRIAPLRRRRQLRRPWLDIRRPGGKRIRLKREGSRPERFGIRLRRSRTSPIGPIQAPKYFRKRKASETCAPSAASIGKAFTSSRVKGLGSHPYKISAVSAFRSTSPVPAPPSTPASFSRHSAFRKRI